MSKETETQVRVERIKAALTTYDAVLIQAGITLQGELMDLMDSFESTNLTALETKEIITGYVRERMVALRNTLEPDRRRMYRGMLEEGLLHDIDASELEAL